MICKLIQSNKHIPLHPLGGCNKYKKKECVKHPAMCFRLQSPQFNCNLSNPTAISAIQLQSPQSMIKFYLDLPLGVHIPECLKRLAQCFIVQSQQFNCNLHNPTAISAIQLQSPQSNCNLHNPTAISTIRLQSQQSDFNLSNLTAFLAIRLQSRQSNCNLHNQTAMQEDCSLIAEIAG